MTHNYQKHSGAISLSVASSLTTVESLLSFSCMLRSLSFSPARRWQSLKLPVFRQQINFFFCVTAPTWQSQLHLSDCAFPHCSLRTEPSGARAAAASWICIWPSALIKLHFNVRFDWLNHSSYEHTHSPAKLQRLSCSSGFTLTRVHSSLCWPVLNYSLLLFPSLSLPLSPFWLAPPIALIEPH